MAASAFKQLPLALWKCFLLKRRSPCQTLCEIFVPILIVLSLVLGYFISSWTTDPADNYSEILNISGTPESLFGADANLTQAIEDIINQLNGVNASEVNGTEANATINSGISDLCQQTGICLNPVSEYHRWLLPDDMTARDRPSEDIRSHHRRLQQTASSLISEQTNIFNNPLPVLTFDGWIVLQRYLQQEYDNGGSSNFITSAQQYSSELYNILNTRQMAFAPDTPEVREMVDQLNQTYVFFNEIYYGIFPDEDTAIAWAIDEGADKLWSLLVINKFDVTNKVFDYVIRMNQTVTPDTRDVVDKFEPGRGGYYVDYWISGFLSLQNMLDEYWLDYLAGSGDPDPNKLIESGCDRITDGTNLTAANLALLSSSAQSIIPGLPNTIPTNPNTNAIGTINGQPINSAAAAAAGQPRAFATTLPMPVQDSRDNRFFIFGALLAGLVLVFSFLYPVSKTIRDIVTEKETRVREGMFIMGLKRPALFASWWITCFCIMLPTVTVQVFIMKMTFLQKINPAILFILQLLWGLSTISFAFLCSTLFQKARIAAIVGPCLLFSFAVPKFAITPANGVSLMKMISLLCPVAYGYGMDMVVNYERLGRGVQWETINADEYSVQTAMIFLALDTVLYLVLAWYLDGALPTAWGIKRGLCFCLPQSLRRCGRKPEVPTNIEEFDPDPSLIEQVDGEIKGTVHATKLRKVFTSSMKCLGSSNTAVHGLNFTMYEGQINVLLGHNGAGKTTTLSMMTGMIAPTSGDCLIDGKSILTDMPDIRQSLGLCPQHNILWDRLSVEEHLRFYARLKGLNSEEADKAVTHTIADIGLEEKRNNWSSTLSGGMKRRLSVGIALIGGSKVVFLDEPTSGMDPKARRQTWDLLKRNREGRVQILTTHFMDEADLLGDQIAIMSRGKLKCQGSPLFLKNRLGVGYNVALDLREDADRDGITKLIQGALPTATPLSEVAGECTYKLPITEVPNFAGLFRALEDHGPPLGVNSFGLSLTTIEEVFLKIAEEETDDFGGPQQKRLEKLKSRGKKLLPHKKKEEPRLTALTAADSYAEEEPAGIILTDRESVYSEYPPSTNMSQAGLVSARSTLDVDPESFTATASTGAPLLGSDLAQPDPSTPQVVNTPASVFAADRDGAVGDRAISEVEEVDQATVVEVDDDLEALQIKGVPESYCPKFGRQFAALIKKRLHCYKRDRRTWCIQVLIPVIVVIFALALLGIAQPNRPSLLLTQKMYLDLSYVKSVEIITGDCGWSEAEPYFESSYASYSARTAQNSLELSNITFAEYYTHEPYRSGGQIFIDQVATVTIETDTGSLGPLPVLSPATVMHNSTGLHALPTNYNDLNTARVRKLTSSQGGINATNHPLPLSKRQKSQFDAILTLVAAILVLIPFTFFPANCVAWVVKERETGAKHLQVLSGMLIEPYWLSAYLIDVSSMTLTSILTILVFVIFDQEDLVGDVARITGVFLLFFLYAFSSIALGYLLSFLFRTAATAQNTLTLVFFLFGFILVLSSEIMKTIDGAAAEVNEKLTLFYRLVPAFCLGEGIIKLSSLDFQSLIDQREYHVYDMNIISRSLIYMAVEAPLFLLATMAIEWDTWKKVKRWWNSHSCCGNRRAGKAGVETHLWEQKKRVCGCCRKKKMHTEPTYDMPDDEDVLLEEAEVNVGEGREDDNITLQHLRKVYPPKGNVGPKVAVKDLSFGVHNQEIFALLGANGAGKTTTLSIMSGEFPPTSGRVLLNGFDIEQERRAAQATLGYCPQFDALLDHLSVEEHLRLYGVLRGVPKSEIPHVSRAIMSYLSLTPHAKKASMALSGGNKRKLSIGIAIIGSPEVVFLDEPSSGLDPVARRALWTAIQVIALKRSIILTTHHLEEVEALAHRVAIMMHGNLRCIGSLQRLKSKFGGAYTLTFKIPPGTEEAFAAWIAEAIPQAVLDSNMHGRVVYQLEPVTDGKNVKISELFEIIEAGREPNSILDFSVSQTTLEDVFLEISEQEESGNTQEGEEANRDRAEDPESGETLVAAEVDADALSGGAPVTTGIPVYEDSAAGAGKKVPEYPDIPDHDDAQMMCASGSCRASYTTSVCMLDQDEFHYPEQAVSAKQDVATSSNSTP